MKKLTVFALVVLMLALSVVPAFAKSGPSANQGSANGNCSGAQSGFGVRAPYALSGTITALDANARTVTVTIMCGNRLAKPLIGQDVTLQTTDATRFLLRNADGSVTLISFEDLSLGQNVSSHGTLTNGVWTAVRVTSGALLNCQP
jgi:Domain of unknown function (DUF5666)